MLLYISLAKACINPIIGERTISRALDPIGRNDGERLSSRDRRINSIVSSMSKRARARGLRDRERDRGKLSFLDFGFATRALTSGWCGSSDALDLFVDPMLLVKTVDGVMWSLIQQVCSRLPMPQDH